jgi:hypothetical protein
VSNHPVIDHRSKGRARNFAEINYAVGLTPCPECGSRVRPRLFYSSDPNTMTVTVDCGVCGARRIEEFATDGDPAEGMHEQMQLGMKAPSEIISPQQFAAELDQLLPLVGDPLKLSGAAHRASSEAAWDAVTAAYELAKFGEHALVLPKAWPQQGTKRETAAARRDELVAIAEQHLAERRAGNERGLAEAKALAATPSAYPPSIAFRLAVETGALAGVDDTLALLSRLSSEQALAHPATFAQKAASIRRTQLVDRAGIGLAAAEGSGVTVTPLPSTSDGWTAWRNAMRMAGKARVNELGSKALDVATAAFDLERARQLQERIAYLRASAPEHAELATQAHAASKTAEGARTRLLAALGPFLVFAALAETHAAIESWADRESYEAASKRVMLDNLPMRYLVNQNEKLREIFAKIAANLPR